VREARLVQQAAQILRVAQDEGLSEAIEGQVEAAGDASPKLVEEGGVLDAGPDAEDEPPAGFEDAADFAQGGEGIGAPVGRGWERATKSAAETLTPNPSPAGRRESPAPAATSVVFLALLAFLATWR